MMKRAFMILLCTVMVFTSVACGSTKEAGESEDSDRIEVEKELFDVTLTIPNTYVGDDVTQESLDADVKEKGFKSATLNDDGSITYVMTKKQHKALMEEIKTTIDEGLQDMCGSDTYPNITSVTVNDDCTKFTVVTKSSELGLSESFSALVLYVYGGMYNAFAGVSVDNIHVDFVNESTGDIIKTADSKNPNSDSGN